MAYWNNKQTNNIGGWWEGWGFTLTEVEVDLWSVPKRSGTFIITTTWLTSWRPVMINQASWPYTWKWTLADEAEMDQLIVSAKTTSTTQIQCYWNSNYFVKKNFKFNYTVSA